MTLPPKTVSVAKRVLGVKGCAMMGVSGWALLWEWIVGTATAIRCFHSWCSIPTIPPTVVCKHSIESQRVTVGYVLAYSVAGTVVVAALATRILAAGKVVALIRHDSSPTALISAHEHAGGLSLLAQAPDGDISAGPIGEDLRHAFQGVPVSILPDVPVHAGDHNAPAEPSAIVL